MMLTGYFDDSGHITDKKALVVSGFVAPIGQWRQFEKDWRALLRRPEFRLDYLHMKEFRRFEGQYERFSHNLQLQTDFFTRVHAVIGKRIERPFGCIMKLEDYDRVNREYMLRETHGHPFAMAGAITIHFTLRWMEKVHPTDRIDFVFDHDTDGWGDFEAQCKKRFRTVTPMPGTFRKQLPLQAADHVAWEKRRAAEDIINANSVFHSVRFRKSFDALMDRFGGDTWNYVDEGELMKVVNDRKEPTPRRVSGV